MKLTTENSRIIDALRFPLIIGVVFIHAYTRPTENLSAVDNLWYLNGFVQNIVSQVFARTSVPMFFIISGLLLYRGEPIDLEIVKRKFASRARTLIQPYIIWNSVVIIIQFAGQVIPVTRRFFSGNIFDIKNISLYSVLDAYVGLNSRPVNVPLWFLRDLIILVFLSPLLYVVVRKIGYLLCFFLFLIWVKFPVHIDFPLISEEAVFFFTIGIFLSTERKAFIPERFWDLKGHLPLYLGLCYLAVSIFEAHLMTVKHPVFFLHKINLLFGIGTIFILLRRVISNSRIFSILRFLAPVSFFVYLAHGNLLQCYEKSFDYFSNPSSCLMSLLNYFGSTVLTILTLVGLFFMLHINFPKFCDFLLGKRSKGWKPAIGLVDI